MRASGRYSYQGIGKLSGKEKSPAGVFSIELRTSNRQSMTMVNLKHECMSKEVFGNAVTFETETEGVA